MAEYHEPYETLAPQTQDFHRAIRSLIEELEAVDWYEQRIAAAQDDSLREVLAHNRDEEKEHAVMLLEWLRRRMPGWDGALRAYLFTERPVTQVESGLGATRPGRLNSLGLGDLRKNGEEPLDYDPAQPLRGKRPGEEGE